MKRPSDASEGGDVDNITVANPSTPPPKRRRFSVPPDIVTAMSRLLGSLRFTQPSKEWLYALWFIVQGALVHDPGLRSRLAN